MTRRVECPHEGDVLDLAATGQWPARADAALRAHVAGCRVCADLAATVAAIVDLGDDRTAAPRLPDASVIWYRAAVDAYRDASRRASVPVIVVEAGAAVAAAGVAWTSHAAIESWLVAGWHAIAGALPRSWTWPPAAERTVAFFGTASPALAWAVAAGIGGTLVVVLLAIWLAQLADRSVDTGPADHHRLS